MNPNDIRRVAAYCTDFGSEGVTPSSVDHISDRIWDYNETDHELQPERSIEGAALADGPESCDRFDRCSAPLCPLDPEYEKRVHQDGERVCYYMLQAVKPGAAARFLGGPTETLFNAAAKVVAQRESLGRPLRKALDRASKQGRRIVPIGSTNAVRK